MKLFVSSFLTLSSFVSLSQAQVGHQCTPTALISVPAEGFVSTSDEWKYIAKCSEKLVVESARLVSLEFTVLSEVECRYIRHPHTYGQPGAYGEIHFIR